MAKQRLFVIDKPSVAKHLEPIIRKHFPEDDIRFVPIITFGLHQFDYPKGLKMYDYPYVDIPQLKQGGRTDIYAAGYIENILKQADEIIFACTPDHTGAVAFYFMLVSFLGVEQAQAQYRAVKITAYSPSEIEKALVHMGTTSDDWYCEILRYGVAKRYFEYNYNVNSMALFGLVLRHLGIDTQNYTISKNSLQLLFFISHLQQPVTFQELVQDLCDWRGTGKYTSDNQPRLPLGSPASRSTMVDGLVQHGLLIEEGKYYSISAKGQEFLNLLHRECNDQDLPYRLHQWCLEWNDSKPNIDRYLRTFFGRQKRFFRKMTQSV